MNYKVGDKYICTKSYVDYFLPKIVYFTKNQIYSISKVNDRRKYVITTNHGTMDTDSNPSEYNLKLIEKKSNLPHWW